MAADDSKTSKSDFMMSVLINFTMVGASSGFFKHNARTLVFSFESSIWHCSTMPTLYTSTIAREVKMRLLIISLASSLARKVRLRIKIQVATEGHCRPSLTSTSLEWIHRTAHAQKSNNYCVRRNY